MFASLELHLTRAARIGVVVAIFAACVLVVQKSFHFAALAPALTADDSIPNVAVSLAEYGRYGFLSSPTEGPHQVDRTHAFYRYGPIYFFVAAALAWLLGPSLLLFRMLHPLGLVAVVIAAFTVFRRISLVGAAVFALTMCSLYLGSQRPLARPDVTASVCTALMLVCAARAMDSGRAIGWCGVGFFAGSALTSDMSAASIVPAAGLIWLWSQAAERRAAVGPPHQRAVTNIAPLIAGTAAAAIMYLVAIDFRLRDVWALNATQVSLRPRSMGRALTVHFSDAWSPVGRWTFWLALAGFCGAVLVATYGRFSDEARRRRALALVTPPVVAATVCQLGVAFFDGSAPAASILAQVTTIWAACAAISVAMAWIGEQYHARFAGAELIALVCVLGLMARVEYDWLTTKTLWERMGVGQVNAEDYVRQVLAPLPERAAIWGSLYAGLDAGDRTDLVEFQQAFEPALDYPPDHRDNVAPAYLVLGRPELEDAVALTLAGQNSSLLKFSFLFPKARYRAVRLVNAPPYGTTVVYRRANDAEPDDAPAGVAVNDGSGRQWTSRLSNPLPVSFTHADGVTAEVTLRAMHVERAAVASRSATLEPGFYVIDVDVKATQPDASAFILATPARRFIWAENTGDLPVVPCLPGSSRVAVLVDHPGGPLYVSRFARSAASDASLEVRSVRRVLTLSHKNADVDTRPLQVAFPAGWARTPGELQVLPDPDGGFQVAAAAGGVKRLESPPIPVERGRRMILTIPVDTMGSVVTAGVSGSNGAWAVAPIQLPRRIVFDTGTSDRVRIVLSSAGRWRALSAPAMWPFIPEHLYVDRLMGCRSPYIHLTDLGCGAPHAPGLFNQGGVILNVPPR